MPGYAIWTFIVSFILLSLGSALIISELKRRLKASEDETSRLRSELEMLRDKYSQEISDIKEQNNRVVIELKEEISKLSPLPFQIHYFNIGNDLKWKTKIFDNGEFEVDDKPICKTHDLPFIPGSNGIYCPEARKPSRCKNVILHEDRFNTYETAKSHIDKIVRNKAY